MPSYPPSKCVSKEGVMNGYQEANRRVGPFHTWPPGTEGMQSALYPCPFCPALSPPAYMPLRRRIHSHRATLPPPRSGAQSRASSSATPGSRSLPAVPRPVAPAPFAIPPAPSDHSRLGPWVANLLGHRSAPAQPTVGPGPGGPCPPRPSAGAGHSPTRTATAWRRACRRTGAAAANRGRYRFASGDRGTVVPCCGMAAAASAAAARGRARPHDSPSGGS